MGSGNGLVLSGNNWANIDTNLCHDNAPLGHSEFIMWCGKNIKHHTITGTHYRDFMMTAMAFQITSLTIVYSTRFKSPASPLFTQPFI